MKILVTGADGFIGSHLVEALVKRGHQVRAFVLYNSFNSWGWLDDVNQSVRDSLDVFAGDIRDPHGVDAAVSGQEVILACNISKARPRPRLFVLWEKTCFNFVAGTSSIRHKSCR